MEIIREQHRDFSLWIAILRDERVGRIGIYRQRKNTGHIGYFEVLPEHRELGIGSNLLVQALKDVKAEGVEVIRVCVFPPETRALNLYEQAGFVPIAKRIFVVGQYVDLGLKLK